MKNHTDSKQEAKKVKGLHIKEKEKKQEIFYCVECGEPVGENESMWNMHNYCRMAGVTGVF